MKRILTTIKRTLLISILTSIVLFLFAKSLVLARFLLVKSNFTLICLLPLGAIIIYYSKRLLGNSFSKNKSKNKELVGNIYAVIKLMWISFLSHLFGASVGKEGVGVEIGTKISEIVNQKNIDERHQSITANEVNYIKSIGIASGFSAIFLTPLSAITYAMEKTVSNHNIAATNNTMLAMNIFIASIVSYSFSILLGNNKIIHEINHPSHIDAIYILKCVVIIVMSYAVGFSYEILSKRMTIFYDKIKIKDIYKFVIISIILAFPLYIFKGRYSGSGEILIDFVFKESKVITYYDFIMKYILTLICLTIGFSGGKIMPLFAIGSSLGVLLAKLLNFDLSISSMVAMLACFGGGTNTILTPLFIGLEIFKFKN